MEKEPAEKEMDSIVDNEEEEGPAGDPAVTGGSAPTAEPGLCEEPRGTEEEEEHEGPSQEVSTEGLPSNPRDAPAPDPAAPLTSGNGETESCWGGPSEGKGGRVGRPRALLNQFRTLEVEVSAERIILDERASEPGCRKTPETIDDDDEEEEDGQGGESPNATMDGAESSGWRNSTGGAGGKRCRSRNSGSEQQSNPSYTAAYISAAVPPPSSSSSSSSAQKGSLSGAAPSGSRHKQTRRRNAHHQQGRGRRRTGGQFVGALREMLSDSLSTWCMSCVHMVIDLIVTLTHNCGVGVEAGGVAVYGLVLRLLARVMDVPGMKADARTILEWTRVRGAGVVSVVLTTLTFAKRAFMACCGMFFVIAILGYLGSKRLFVRLGGERGQRWWAALLDWRFWGAAGSRLARVLNWFRRAPGRPTRPSYGSSSPESPGRTTPGGRYQPDQELERLLAMAQVPEEELDPFAVLGVEVHATETELKRAYRQLAVQVHPDKNKHPRAGEAFKVLRAAWDIVSNPETRREFELKRMAATELSKSMNEFLTKLQDDLKEAMNTMMCTKCEGKHKRFEMSREPAEARFCAECNRCHSAEEGDLWAESSMLGLRITYFAFMDGKVYDITEWAGCQRIGISPDTHRVPYHISFGSKNNSSSTRQRTTSENGPSPSNPADLQDFFNRIFQGGPVNDMTANGGFFPSGGPSPGGAGAAGAGGGATGGGMPPPFSPPQNQTGFWPPPMPGERQQQQQRPEPGGETSTSWTESAKPPPRRKKKVRKPFQR